MNSQRFFGLSRLEILKNIWYDFLNVQANSYSQKKIQSDVEIAAANVLDIAAEIDPSKIIAKIKYHLLGHLREDIIRFGPLVGGATESFESYNAIFRFCSILSNHMAPSRDIANQLSKQETVKFILSGGWSIHTETGRWEQPGVGVRSYVKNQPALQKLCGWTETETTTRPGKFQIHLI